MKDLRIVIFNVGYLTGITGRVDEYVRKGARFISPTLGRREIAEKFTNFLKEVNPDILFLAEIRDEPYMAPIKDFFAENHIDQKYEPKSLLHDTPFFRGNCNGVFLRDDFPTQKFFLENGSKKLVYRVDPTEDSSVLFSHFALGKKTREKQFSELAAIMAREKERRWIIAGDFNIFHGVEELSGLFKNTNVRLVNDVSAKTFPSYRPKHVIDLFLTSPSIRQKGIEVRDDICISDHLPVVADFEL